MRQRKIAVLVIAVLLLAGCAVHKTGTNGQPAAPVTGLEQANANNAEISVHNRAAAKTLIAAYQSGVITKEYFDSISKLQISITRSKKSLTPLLKDQSTAMSSKDKIQNLTNQIAADAAAIIQSGTVGIKDVTTRNAVADDIKQIAVLANSIITSVSALKGANQ